MKPIGPKEQALRDLKPRFATGLTDEGKAGRAERAAKAGQSPAGPNFRSFAPGEFNKTRKAAAAKALETGKAAADAAAAKARAKKAAKGKTPVSKKNAPAAAPERPYGLRPGSKMEAMLGMALRPQGATEAAICKKLGWKKCRVTLKRTAVKAGAVLRQERNKAGEIVYFATIG